MLSKYFIDPEKAYQEAAKPKIRQEEMLLSNLKFQLIGKLRQEGAIKIAVGDFEWKEKEIEVKAKFNLNGFKEGAFLFRANHMRNFILKGFENSLDNAEPVQAEKFDPADAEIECKMPFDLSKVMAKEFDNEVELIYPTVGPIGVISKSNVNPETVKKLCSLAADFYGLVPDFMGELKITPVKEDEIPETETSDKFLAEQQKIKSFVKENGKEKERSKFLTLRNNFIKSIEGQAGNLIKKLTTSYRTGSTKIISTDTSLEYVNNKFDGHILVKAKIGKKILTYALPVVQNQLTVKNVLEAYLTDEATYENKLGKQIDAKLKAGLSQDLDLIAADFTQQLIESKVGFKNKIEGARASEIQKSFKADKNFLPKELGPGDTITFNSGITYRIEGEKDAQVYTLVLVS